MFADVTNQPRRRGAQHMNAYGKLIGAIPPIALGAAACSQQDSQPQRPNIVLIVADDLGIGDVSCYGSRTISTPNLDGMASDGLMLANGYATSSTSTPSRFALFTGMYPWRNPEAKILPGDAPLLIDPSMPTLPKMMQSDGYSTAAIGKWHLGMGCGELDWNGEISPSGNTVGFDYTNLIPATVDRVPTVYVENGRVVGLDPADPIEVSYERRFPGEPDALSNPELMTMPWRCGHQGTIINGIPRIGYMKGGHSARWDDSAMADYFLGKAKDFISSHKDSTFFLYYGLHEPHVPRVPAQRFVGSSGLGCRGDAVVEADWCVGELLRHIDSLGLADNTLIIFTSDNGAVLQDGYEDHADQCATAAGHDPDGGLRGGKYSLYDAGTHIPFIVRWTGHVTPGTVSKAYFCQMDLFATIGEMTGAEYPESMDSEPYPDVLLGRTLHGGRQEQILEAQGRLALRSGHYVMIPAYDGDNYDYTGIDLGYNSHDTLWNLEEDPAQRSDLSGTESARLREMKAAFLRTVGELYREPLPTGQPR